MDVLAFVLALIAEGKTAEEIKAAVDEYLEENPGAIDQAAVEAIVGEALAEQDAKLDDIEDDVGGLKSAVADLEEGSLSALGAANNQVPTAHGDGTWSWQTPSGVNVIDDTAGDGDTDVTWSADKLSDMIGNIETLLAAI